ncbi:MAG: DUF6020 family protein [Bifidobacteriaceae bacterium]|nr:DUF6020 family protein [Bifidobacteriaceae bacterium]
MLMGQSTGLAAARSGWADRRPAIAWAAATGLGLATAYALAVFDHPGVADAVKAGGPGLIGPVLLFAAITATSALWYRRGALTRPFILTAGVLSVLFTFWTITGLSLKHHRAACHWSNCALDWPSDFTPAAAIGFLILYYAAAAAVLRAAERLVASARPSPGTPSGGTMPPGSAAAGSFKRLAARLGGLVAAHPFAVAAGVIVVSWLPYVVIFFPGTYAFDGFRQLNEFYGHLDRTTHHPYLATTLMGGLFSIGKILGPNGGLFVYTLAQATAACLIFALTSAQVFRLAAAAFGRGRAAAFTAYGLTLGFFALVPVFPVAVTVVFKDFPYTLSVLLLASVLVRTAVERLIDAKTTVLFVVGSIGAATFRNDGIFIVVASAVCLIALLGRGSRPRQRRAVAVAAGFVAAGLTVVNAVVFPALGVAKYSNAEMLSLPLQQTARYLRDHGDEVTDDQRDTLQSLLRAGQTVEDLAENYSPTLSDPVKNRFESFDSESFRRYLGVWWEMFKRHPATFAEATAANTYGYFWPTGKSSAPPIQYPDLIHLREGYWEDEMAGLTSPDAGLKPDYPAALAPARAGVIKAAKAVITGPVTWPLFAPGAYTWVLLIAAAALIRRRRWRALIPFAPAALVFLVCLASPVNSNLRYALPYVVTVPLLVVHTLYALARPPAAIGGLACPAASAARRRGGTGGTGGIGGLAASGKVWQASPPAGPWPTGAGQPPGGVA